MSQNKSNPQGMDYISRRNLEGVRLLMRCLEFPNGKLFSQLHELEKRFDCFSELHDLVNFCVFQAGSSRESERSILESMVEHLRIPVQANSLSSGGQPTSETEFVRKIEQEGKSTLGRNDPDTRASDDPVKPVYPETFYNGMKKKESISMLTESQEALDKEGVSHRHCLLSEFVQNVLATQSSNTKSALDSARKIQCETGIEEIPSPQSRVNIEKNSLANNMEPLIDAGIDRKSTLATMNNNGVHTRAPTLANPGTLQNPWQTSAELETPAKINRKENKLPEVNSEAVTSSFMILNRFCDALLSVDAGQEAVDLVPNKPSKENTAFAALQKQLTQAEDSGASHQKGSVPELAISRQCSPDTLEARDIAERVNDVLIEQALRQGVTLL